MAPLGLITGLLSIFTGFYGLCFYLSATSAFRARIKTPFVLGELLNPVSATNSTSLNPACGNISRKSIPGIAPPSHLNQLLIRFFIFGCNLPTKI